MKTWVLTLSPPTEEKPGAPVVSALGARTSRRPGAGWPVLLNPQTQSQSEMESAEVKHSSQPLTSMCACLGHMCTHEYTTCVHTENLFSRIAVALMLVLFLYSSSLKYWVGNIGILKMSQVWYTLISLSLKRLKQGDCEFETKSPSQTKERKKQNPKNPKMKTKY